MDTDKGIETAENEMISRLRTVTRKGGRPNSTFEAVIIGNDIVFRPGQKRSKEDSLWMMRMALFMIIASIISSFSIFYMSPRDMNGWIIEVIALTIWVILGIGAVLYLRPFIRGTFEFCRIDTVNKTLTCDDIRIPLTDIERFTGSGIDVYAITRDGDKHLIMSDPIHNNSQVFIQRALKVLGTTCAIPTSIESDEEGEG
ncbi:MAG: hypothetical protein ACYC27_19475 [Armatimonadota bacterium]